MTSRFLPETLGELLAPWLSLCQFERCVGPGSDRGSVVCAVSGGADSLALLALAVAQGFQVRAIHVDHGLRPGSDSEAAVVAAAANDVGADFSSVRVSVEHGSNLEARARAARYGVLPPDVFTGHTMDDLAETVIANLLRGAGLDGLSPFVRGGPTRPQRPLLGLRRSQTAEICSALGWTPVDDPMNHDPSFQRVRIRHELLPLMNEVAARDVVAVLARQATLFAMEVSVLTAAAAALDPSDAKALAAAPEALAHRALREWFSRIGVGGDEGHLPDGRALARALDVACGRAGATDLGSGWRLERSAQRLRVVRNGIEDVPE